MLDIKIGLPSSIQNILTIHKNRIEFLIKSIAGSVIMIFCTQITIPLPFVPITGQTLGLTIVSLSMGRKSATAALILYLLEGISGIPIFSGGRFGLSHILGPTGGYLIGFIPAAYIMGYFSDLGCLHSFLKSSIAVLLGSTVVFVFGLAQLSFFVPANKLLSIGLYPFILSEIIKGVFMIMIIPGTYQFFSKIK